MKQSKSINNNTYILKNNGKDHELLQLLEFRNIIVRQLYLMSQIIVTKTLYDGVHQSFILKDESDVNVIGGICFYEIPQHKCVSIVYFAVDSQYQMKGYGNYLMNKFKYEMNAKNYETIATQADIISLNFYYKNGFIDFERKNKTIQRPPRQDQIEDKDFQQELCTKFKKYEPWLQYIQDYYASILVVYKMHPNIKNKEFSQITSIQKRKLIQILNQANYRGNKFPLQKTQKIIKTHRKLYEKQKQTIVSKESIQEIRSSLQKQKLTYTNSKQVVQRLQQITLLDILRNHKYSWVLNMNFIKFNDTFHVVLSNLITIPDIQNKIVNKLYHSTSEMCADITKLFENLRLLLASRSNYFQACQKLQQFINKYITQIYQGTFDVAKYNKKMTEINKSQL